MKYDKNRNIGMELLIQLYRKKFETEENINYYVPKDFLKAERKYLKYMIAGPIDKHLDQSQ